MQYAHSGVNSPIDPSITFEVGDAEEPAKFFSEGIPSDRALYGRFGHPNFRELESRLEHMEGGERALLFASGMAATFALFFSQLAPGDHVVVSSRIYGGTRGQINMLAQALNLRVSIVDIVDIRAVRDVCTKETKLLFAETVSNPDMVVADVRALGRICHSDGNDILVCVDNTFTPLIARPLLCGADVVMHSLTKYVNGRSDALGGALVGSSVLMEKMSHPATGEASLVGGVIHYAVAHEMAERFANIKDRVCESSRRAGHLAQLFTRAGLSARYTLFDQRIPEGQFNHLGEVMGGGVFSVAFTTEAEGIRFVDYVKNISINDPLHGAIRLAIPAVSLGSAHTYVWCTTEARAQSTVTKWPALPFAPVPFGFVRIAVGYLGDRELVYQSFEEVLIGLGYTLAPQWWYHHT